MRKFYLVAVAIVLLACNTQSPDNQPPRTGPYDAAQADRDFLIGSRSYWRGDFGKALEHIRPAAEFGHPNAQEVLGVMYRKGAGVTQDYDQAIKWYCKAAVLGEPRSISNLGVMHRNGFGVPKNDDKALKWYRMAAELGNPGAQLNMGIAYLFGRGLAKDDVLAFLWLSLAAKGDFDGAKRAAQLRDDAAGRLYPDQLKAGKAQVATWKSRPFNQAREVRLSDTCSPHVP